MELEDEFPCGMMAYFQVLLLLVSGRVAHLNKSFLDGRTENDAVLKKGRIVESHFPGVQSSFSGVYCSRKTDSLTLKIGRAPKGHFSSKPPFFRGELAVSFRGLTPAATLRCVGKELQRMSGIPSMFQGLGIRGIFRKLLEDLIHFHWAKTWKKNKGKLPQCSGFHNFNLQLQGEVYNTVDASEIRRSPVEVGT